MSEIKALTFDTGGTLLDWYSGISSKLKEIGDRRGVEADWAKITHEYRIKSLMMMAGGEESFRPDFNIDDVHRIQIEEVAKANELNKFTKDDLDEVRDTWHSLDCWADVPTGLARLRSKHIVSSLSILSLRLIIDTCKRSDIVWDSIISCETIGAYKPRAHAYTQAAKWLQLQPSECLMVASHGTDLNAAANVGFKTDYINRHDEWGPAGEPDFMKSEMNYDYVADDFNDLADQLGCASR